MNDFRQEVETIQRAYPDFEISSVELNLAGQYNRVLLINGDTIFRFPRFATGIEQLVLETEILTAVQPFLSLSVPNPTYACFDTAVVGRTFMGYKMIAGEALWLPTFKQITDEVVWERLARQLATFLRELHHVPIEALLDTSLPVSDSREEWEDIYGRVQENLFPYMHLVSSQG